MANIKTQMLNVNLLLHILLILQILIWGFFVLFFFFSEWTHNINRILSSEVMVRRTKGLVGLYDSVGQSVWQQMVVNATHLDANRHEH